MFAISKKGIALITHYEGLCLRSYKDSVGILTIGFGHTGEDVKENMSITTDQAMSLLYSDLKFFEGIINKNVTSEINQDQFDALVSIVYNIGPGAKGIKDGIITLKDGSKSSLLKDVNSSNFAKAASDFLAWNKAGGKVLNGLTRRRTSESVLFSTGKLDFMNVGKAYV